MLSIEMIAMRSYNNSIEKSRTTGRKDLGNVDTEILQHAAYVPLQMLKWMQASLSGDEIQFNFLNPENDFVVRVMVHNWQIQVCFVKNKGTFSSK